MSRDKIPKAFDMYIKRCKSLIFGGELCDIWALALILPAE